MRSRTKPKSVPPTSVSDDPADDDDDQHDDQDRHGAHGRAETTRQANCVAAAAGAAAAGEKIFRRIARSVDPSRPGANRRLVIPDCRRPFVPRSSAGGESSPRPAVACRCRTGGHRVPACSAPARRASWCVLEASQVRRKEGKWRIWPKETRLPTFALEADDGSRFRLADHKGGKVVVYFYPKDDTQGCTIEAIDFTKAAPAFAKAGTKVVGISPDTVASHCKFRDKHGPGDHAGRRSRAQGHRSLWRVGREIDVRPQLHGRRTVHLPDRADGRIARAWRQGQGAGSRRGGAGGRRGSVEPWTGPNGSIGRKKALAFAASLPHSRVKS